MIRTIRTAALVAATVLTCMSIPLAGVGQSERVVVKPVDYDLLPETPLSFGYFTAKDGTLIRPGITIGERFAGQALRFFFDFDATHDALVGLPTAPLKVLPGRLVPNENLYQISDAFTTPPTAILLPLAPGDLERVLSRPNSGFFGNGAASFLFDADVRDFGFGLISHSEIGTAVVRFFRQDGSLVDEVFLTSLDPQFYGFTIGNHIPEIRGVSITTDQPRGVGLIDVKFGSAFEP